MSLEILVDFDSMGGIRMDSNGFEVQPGDIRDAPDVTRTAALTVSLPVPVDFSRNVQTFISSS